MEPGFGPALRHPGRASFRLWAPARASVELEIDGAAPLPMRREPGGWFQVEASAAPGARYLFHVGQGLRVPDPASRAQAADGWSVLTDPGAYRWRHPDWSGRPWHESVVYEMHAGALGGFERCAECLPELARLGITAIELMPVAETPGQRNWGYDGVLPYAPCRALGTPHQLKALVDAAHALRLSVYLDVVYNHFGPDGNFLPAYAPQFFREDRQTPWGPAIDFRRAEVRRFFEDNALYWLGEFRFDGLRLDAVHTIGDPGWLESLAARVRARTAPGRCVHLVLENEGNEAVLLDGGRGRRFDAQWNDDAHNALHVLLTGEREGYYAAHADAPAERLARVLAEGFSFQGEGGRGTPSAQLPPTAFVFFLQNHDQVGNRAFGERLTALAHRDALRAAVLLQLLCPQVPLLFMGEEWGCTAPFLFFTDHRHPLADQVREGRRREFAQFAAFTDPTARARIPDPNAPATFQASVPDRAQRETADGRAWLAYYESLLRVRREWLVPRLPCARGAGARAVGEGAVVARWDFAGAGSLVIASNFQEQDVAIEPIVGRMLAQSGGSGPWPRETSGPPTELAYLSGRSAVALEVAA